MSTVELWHPRILLARIELPASTAGHDVRVSAEEGR